MSADLQAENKFCLQATGGGAQDVPAGATAIGDVRACGMGTFGDLIADLQGRKGWSFSRMSRESTLSITRLQDILKMDEPKVYGSTLEKLAGAFGMTVEELKAEYVRRRDAADGASVTLWVKVPREALDLILAGAARAKKNPEEYAAALLMERLAELTPVSLSSPPADQGDDATGTGVPRAPLGPAGRGDTGIVRTGQDPEFRPPPARRPGRGGR